MLVSPKLLPSGDCFRTLKIKIFYSINLDQAVGIHKHVWPANFTSQAVFCSIDVTHLVTLKNAKSFRAEVTSFG